MEKRVKGLHHVTAMAANANENNQFFTKILGLRRVKKTVNFDAPEVYHLYYGDEFGTPGSVMTYFPFDRMPKGSRGTGEVGVTEFAVPEDSLPFWQDRFEALGVNGLKSDIFLGENRIEFEGPDGDSFALVEAKVENRSPWAAEGIGVSEGILGFHGARFRLRDATATGELLTFMGYEKEETDGNITRYRIEGGNAARIIDLEELPDAQQADEGSGSVHHIAFAVEDRMAQLEVRKALLDTGYQVTPVIDRDYFWSIYFQTSGGVLFEIATNEPGFDRDEDAAHLGEALKLPERYRPYREQIEKRLSAID